jgi:hypothetical protein
MKEYSTFDLYAPIVALFTIVLPWLFYALFPGTYQAIKSSVKDILTDHFDGRGDRGTVTRSAPFTDEDIESALRKREAALKRSELLDAIPVVKDMSKAAKAAVITPESVKRDSIEERPGVFAFQVDTTEDFKEREGILN